jgi:DNA-binding transcriptional MocR family regulator
MTAVACGWMEDGTVARLEEEKRRDAAMRQSLLADILGRLKRIGHPSSYFVWLPLAQELRADEIAMALIREGVSVSTAQPFSTSAHVTHAIRLAIGSVDLATLRRSLEVVARVIADRTY